MLADPHLKAREYYAYLDHPEPAVSVRAYDGPPVRLSATPVELRRAAPLLGEHTIEIATTILGLSEDETAALIAEQVLH